jgi:dihydroneopterin aldolase
VFGKAAFAGVTSAGTLGRVVAEAIVAVGTGEPHHLLESLARQMLEAVRERFPRVRRIQIELRKLNPPSCPGHPAYAAVRLVRGDA